MQIKSDSLQSDSLQSDSPPTGSETGNRNLEISAEIAIWNRRHQLGVTFDSSTGFTLPNGVERSPDTVWIRRDRWDHLPASEKKKFAKIVPDFVIKLLSDGQNLTELKEKMAEYMAFGCSLGWLIDPQKRHTYIYSENGDVQTIPFENTLSGGEALPGLDVRWADVI